MYERAIESLRNPEDYCEESLCILGTAFLGLTIDPLNLSSVSKCVGVFFIQRLKGQEVTLSNESLLWVANLKRWDATQRSAGIFLIAKDISYYRIRLDQEFETLQFRQELDAIFLSVRNARAKLKSANSPLNRFGENSLFNEIEFFNTCDKDCRSNGLWRRIKTTTNPSQKIALHIMLLCNELFHIDQATEDKIQEIYTHCSGDASYDSANLQSLTLLYQLKFVPLIVNERKAFVSGLNSRIEIYSNAVSHVPDQWLRALDLLVDEINAHEAMRVSQFNYLSSLYQEIIESQLANKQALLDVIMLMTNDGSYKKCLRENRYKVERMKIIMQLQLACQASLKGDCTKLITDADKLIESKQLGFDKLDEQTLSTSLKLGDHEEAIEIWQARTTCLDSNVNTGKINLSSRIHSQELSILADQGWNFKVQIDRLILDINAMMNDIKRLQKKVEDYQANHTTEEEARNKIVTDFVAALFKENQDKQKLLQDILINLEKTMHTVQLGIGVLQRLEKEKNKFGKTIRKHGLSPGRSSENINTARKEDDSVITSLHLDENNAKRRCSGSLTRIK